MPRLRFPEFHNAEEWEEKRLGDLGTLVSGLTYSPTDVQDGGLLRLALIEHPRTAKSLLTIAFMSDETRMAPTSPSPTTF